MATEELVIDVRGMTKRFGARTVVNNIDLRVQAGQIYGFLGPNGSGKTTFIRMLCGLLHADAGSGTCLGHDVIKESRAIKLQVGYMTQRFSFYRCCCLVHGQEHWPIGSTVVVQRSSHNH
jgi:ABC-2 type transport system ATP-binding protein